MQFEQCILYVVCTQLCTYHLHQMTIKIRNISTLEIFVLTFSMIYFTLRDMLCRINSSLIFRKNFFNKQYRELLRQLLNFIHILLHIKGEAKYTIISKFLMDQLEEHQTSTHKVVSSSLTGGRIFFLIIICNKQI